MSAEINVDLSQDEWDLIAWALRYVEADTEEDASALAALSHRLSELGLV